MTEPDQQPRIEPASYVGRTCLLVFIVVAVLWLWDRDEPQIAAPLMPTPSQSSPLDKTLSQGSTYRAPYSPSFGGYECTVDCSGHEAGHAWAERNAIDDEDDCTGNSQSFIEGCQAYVEENAEQKAGEGSEEDSDESSDAVEE